MGAGSNLASLTRYKAWADRVLFESMAALPPAEVTAPRPIVFGSILRTLNHVCVMDEVWRAHLEGRPHGYDTRNPVDCPSLEELAAKQADMDGWYVAYGASLTEEATGQTVEFTFIGGGEGAMTRADIILHVVNHTTYHRGHIGDMIYQIPAEPPTTDYPVFLREQARS